MSDDLVRRWDEYVESMGCVMGEVEHMAQQMRDRIEADAKRITELALAAHGALTQADEAYQAQLTAEARIAELEAALREMRDDKTGYRHAVHFRRRIVAALGEKKDG